MHRMLRCQGYTSLPVQLEQRDGNNRYDEAKATMPRPRLKSRLGSPDTGSKEVPKLLSRSRQEWRRPRASRCCDKGSVLIYLLDMARSSFFHALVQICSPIFTYHVAGRPMHSSINLANFTYISDITIFTSLIYR